MLIPRQSLGAELVRHTDRIQAGVSSQVCTIQKMERCAELVVECDRTCDAQGRQSQGCINCRNNLGDCRECSDTRLRAYQM